MFVSNKIHSTIYHIYIKGDSGGPLTVDVDGKHFLIGDVSFGFGEDCGQVSWKYLQII